MNNRMRVKGHSDLTRVGIQQLRRLTFPHDHVENDLVNRLTWIDRQKAESWPERLRVGLFHGNLVILTPVHA